MNEDQLRKHLEDVRQLKEDMHDVKHVIFGDPSTQEVGMKAKLDKIYILLIQVEGLVGFLRGLKWFAGAVVAITAAWALIKGMRP